MAITLFSHCSTPQKEQPPADLFQEGGTDWIMGGDADWQFEGGEITGKLDSGSGFIMTRPMFGDFEFTVEFNPDSTVNSGIFVRCKEQELSFSDCYEINIWDLHPNQEFRTGSIVTRMTPMAIVHTIGKWNTYRIKLTGNSIEAWINGEQTAKLTDDQLKSGYIGLQAAGTGAISFRNARIREL